MATKGVGTEFINTRNSDTVGLVNWPDSDFQEGLFYQSANDLLNDPQANRTGFTKHTTQSHTMGFVHYLMTILSEFVRSGYETDCRWNNSLW